MDVEGNVDVFEHMHPVEDVFVLNAYRHLHKYVEVTGGASLNGKW